MAEQKQQGAGAVPAVRVVHVIFKTHLDLGFTDLACNVAALYRTEYIPRALRLARDLRQAGGPDRFVWTTGSWLVDDYLRWAGPEERAQMEVAIAAGDMTWHGLPVTFHSELLDPSLFRFGLDISRRLDARFGKQTIAAKMTDVPGHTRGIVSLLAGAGIRFLHLGVNPASTPPDVPPLFLWRDAAGAEVVVMYDKGSYGGITVIPGFDEALVFAHTNDNLGPQSAEDVHAVFQMLREQFPAATVMASTLDSFATALLAAGLALPVVTAEIGDTWIHGAGSDPGKIARYRALCRLRRAWLADGRTVPDDFSRALLLIPEHTWGMDEKTYLGDDQRYAAVAFRAARGEERFRRFEASWAEQRRYLDEAVQVLGDSIQGAEARAALADLVPVRLDHAGDGRVTDFAAPLESAHFSLRLDPRTGAITGLQDKRRGRAWATPSHSLALIAYQTFGRQDYDRFWRQYVMGKRDRETRWWAWRDFTKPGIAAAGAQSATYHPTLVDLWWREDDTACYLHAGLRPDPLPDSAYGCPRLFTLDYVFPHADPSVNVTVQWFEKEASRLPEALWLSFRPLLPDPQHWQLMKLGQPMSPLEVVRNGNRRLHAVETGAEYRGRAGSMRLETLDAPLIAPGEPALLDFSNRRPRLRGGLHCNLYNNVWGTNFPMWYEADARFRFRLTFEPLAAGPADRD